MKKTTDGILRLLGRGAVRRPWSWLAGIAAVSVPAVISMSTLAIDTNLVRLLPDHARASVATRELDGVVGSSSYFALIFESDDPVQLRAVVEEAARRSLEIEGVRSVEYRTPMEFIERYRYLLVSSYYLGLILDEVLDWKAQVSPFVDDLGPPDGDEDALSYAEREDRKEMEERLEQYGSLPEYHSSLDGRLLGIFVRPSQGVTSLGATRRLFDRLQQLADELAATHGIWVGVSGSMRNKVDEYDLIMRDLQRSGWIAAALIFLTLVLSFRSPLVALLPLAPLLLGVVWGFALVPWVVGDLNTITAFLLVVVFGIGIDYSVHLLKRFRVEIGRRSVEAALEETYRSTGVSVAISGVSTALALVVLAASDFRGFSEFGVVGALAVLAVMIAMFLTFPPMLALAHRLGLVRAHVAAVGRVRVPGRRVGVALAVATLIAAVAAAADTRFDYDFRNMRATNEIPEALEAKAKQSLVYRTSRSPAAVFVADDLAALDAALAVLEQTRRREGSTIGRLSSIRDLMPTPQDEAARFATIATIRSELEGSWTRRVENERHREWIEDLRTWTAPDSTPDLQQIPEVMRTEFVAVDGERLLLSIYPAIIRTDGRNAMAFTEELYAIDLPAGISGPVGETPVLAEILWLVTGEGPWLVLATLVGVLLIVWIPQRSLVQALWIACPLVSGLALTLGAMAALGIQLNFFNVVVLPALIGLGVDNGVHYYRRWRELGADTRATHAELLGPLTVASATTIMGYSGMVFASHAGLHSIGLVACLGLALMWAASLFLLPPLLEWRRPAGGAAGDDAGATDDDAGAAVARDQ